MGVLQYSKFPKFRDSRDLNRTDSGRPGDMVVCFPRQYRIGIRSGPRAEDRNFAVNLYLRVGAQILIAQDQARHLTVFKLFKP